VEGRLITLVASVGPSSTVYHSRMGPYYCCVTTEANLLIPLDNPRQVFLPESAAESRI
jgi:hypothetical protein